MNLFFPSGLSYLKASALEAFIASALHEDVGEGDHSTLASVPANASASAQLLLKDSGVLAGVQLAQLIFAQVDSRLQVEMLMADGDQFEPGQVAFRVHGPAQSILTAERLVLNTMQRMSGIATHTAQYVAALAGTNCQILDTRKTTPNFRIAEKWAVAIGGGRNHRYALWDMVMLKDNHIDYAGGIAAAVQATRAYQQHHGLNLKVEVETRNLAEVAEAASLPGVDIILLDNMDLPTLRQAVALVPTHIATEASGGVTLGTVRAVAETGVNYVSSGALIYGARPLDMSLKAL